MDVLPFTFDKLSQKPSYRFFTVRPDVSRLMSHRVKVSDMHHRKWLILDQTSGTKPKHGC